MLCSKDRAFILNQLREATEMETETKKATAMKFNYKLETGESKAATILRLVSEGKSRDEITDELCEMNPKVSRKSNCGSISNTLKAYGLLESVGKGTRSKKSKEEKLAEGKKILVEREKALNGS